MHRRHLRRQHSQSRTLIVDELGLAHAQSRIDIAVINGCIHGYEIKSSKDNLARLHTQMNVYRKTLHKLTIVTASKHLSKILWEMPDWCGIVCADKGPRGGINFRSIKSARSNPEVDPFQLAHLLWKSEVAELLIRLGYKPSELRLPRKRMYRMLCEISTSQQITASIYKAMTSRSEWRDRRVQHA